MAGSISSPLSTLVLAPVGVAPAWLAAYLAPTPWTIAAAAGTTLATTLLSLQGLRRSREMAQLEARQQQLQVAASTAEAQVAASEEKLREAATLDDLTGTLTRLDEVMHRDARLKKPMAFVLIDIDGFRRINAEAGRVIGDRALRTVARAVQASTRGTDYVGRIGGDELAIVLGECFDPRPAVDRVFVALHGETNGGRRAPAHRRQRGDRRARGSALRGRSRRAVPPRRRRSGLGAKLRRRAVREARVSRERRALIRGQSVRQDAPTRRAQAFHGDLAGGAVRS
jgi:GGDEF domain-containing protein